MKWKQHQDQYSLGLAWTLHDFNDCDEEDDLLESGHEWFLIAIAGRDPRQGVIEDSCGLCRLLPS